MHRSSPSRALTVNRRWVAAASRRLRSLFVRPVLSADDHRKYERDGYLIFEPGVPAALLDRVRAEVEPHQKQLPPGPDRFPSWERVYNGWQKCPAVKELALNPQVLGALRELYGRTPLPFQTLNFRVGTEQGVHSDTIHFNSIPSGYMCGVWIALEDVDMDCGPLVFYAGTHQLPEYTLADVGARVVPGSFEGYPMLARHIEQIVREEQFEPRYATLRKGQALIWASNLLHGGAPRRDPARTRQSQVTHYFFAGCKYYTPMFSEGDKVCWRDPEWIA